MRYKVYKLVKDEEVVYVGITTQKYLSTRKAKGYPNLHINNKPFWKECKIVLIEKTDDVSRENYWMEFYRSEGCSLYNIKRGCMDLTDDELRLEQSAYNKKWRNENKEHIKEYSAIYKEENKEKLREYKKVYNKKYKDANKEKTKIYNREYRLRKKQNLVS